MKKKYYNKLVRDRIPEKIRSKGKDCEIKKLKSKEFETELLKKVGEEASGLLSAKNLEELISELADILAVIDEIKKIKKISQKQILEAMQSNFKRKGGFDKRLFLFWSSDVGYKTNERSYKKR
ncbi:MAG: hypothetical protein LiPW15_60 [Parcubacteria group bacterium LiPW_15]|nr:MAG: hypothetical protein LiPW15_60 [Parcubacteria group bacterium LiPW_15]